MSKEIWKYRLSVSMAQTLEMPAGAELLSVHMQYEVPCLWAIVEVTAPTAQRQIIMEATGDLLGLKTSPDNFIGTVLMAGGQFVWHFFDGGELGSYPEILSGKPKTISKRTVERLKSEGWDFFQTGPEEWEWLLSRGDGKIVGRQGDDIWSKAVARIESEEK